MSRSTSTSRCSTPPPPPSREDSPIPHMMLLAPAATTTRATTTTSLFNRNNTNINGNFLSVPSTTTNNNNLFGSSTGSYPAPSTASSRSNSSSHQQQQQQQQPQHIIGVDGSEAPHDRLTRNQMTFHITHALAERQQLVFFVDEGKSREDIELLEKVSRRDHRRSFLQAMGVASISGRSSMVSSRSVTPAPPPLDDLFDDLERQARLDQRQQQEMQQQQHQQGRRSFGSDQREWIASLQRQLDESRVPVTSSTSAAAVVPPPPSATRTMVISSNATSLARTSRGWHNNYNNNSNNTDDDSEFEPEPIPIRNSQIVSLTMMPTTATTTRSSVSPWNDTEAVVERSRIERELAAHRLRQQQQEQRHEDFLRRLNFLTNNGGISSSSSLLLSLHDISRELAITLLSEAQERTMFRSDESAAFELIKKLSSLDTTETLARRTVQMEAEIGSLVIARMLLPDAMELYLHNKERRLLAQQELARRQQDNTAGTWRPQLPGHGHASASPTYSDNDLIMIEDFVSPLVVRYRRPSLLVAHPIASPASLQLPPEFVDASSRRTQHAEEDSRTPSPPQEDDENDDDEEEEIHSMWVKAFELFGRIVRRGRELIASLETLERNEVMMRRLMIVEPYFFDFDNLIARHEYFERKLLDTTERESGRRQRIVREWMRGAIEIAQSGTQGNFIALEKTLLLRRERSERVALTQLLALQHTEVIARCRVDNECSRPKLLALLRREVILDKSARKKLRELSGATLQQEAAERNELLFVFLQEKLRAEECDRRRRIGDEEEVEWQAVYNQHRSASSHHQQKQQQQLDDDDDPLNLSVSSNNDDNNNDDDDGIERPLDRVQRSPSSAFVNNNDDDNDKDSAAAAATLIKMQHLQQQEREELEQREEQVQRGVIAATESANRFTSISAPRLEAAEQIERALIENEQEQLERRSLTSRISANKKMLTLIGRVTDTNSLQRQETSLRGDIAATEQSSRNELLALVAAAKREQQQQEQERLREQQQQQQEEAAELERRQREQEQQQQREQHFTTDRAQFESSESAARTAIEREQHAVFTSLSASAALQHDELQQRAAISANESQQHRPQLLRDEAASRSVAEQLEQQRHRREKQQQHQLDREQQQHDEAAERHRVELSEQDERGLLQSSTALSVSETRVRFAAAAEEASGRRSILAVATRSQCETAEADSRRAVTQQEAATRMQLADSCAASEHQASQAQLERERREAEEERQRLEQQQQQQQREQLHREQRSNLEQRNEAAARNAVEHAQRSSFELLKQCAEFQRAELTQRNQIDQAQQQDRAAALSAADESAFFIECRREIRASEANARVNITAAECQERSVAQNQSAFLASEIKQRTAIHAELTLARRSILNAAVVFVVGAETMQRRSVAVNESTLRGSLKQRAGFEANVLTLVASEQKQRSDVVSNEEHRQRNALLRSSQLQQRELQDRAIIASDEAAATSVFHRTEQQTRPKQQHQQKQQQAALSQAAVVVNNNDASETNSNNNNLSPSPSMSSSSSFRRAPSAVAVAHRMMLTEENEGQGRREVENSELDERRHLAVDLFRPLTRVLQAKQSAAAKEHNDRARISSQEQTARSAITREFVFFGPKNSGAAAAAADPELCIASDSVDSPRQRREADANERARLQLEWLTMQLGETESLEHDDRDDLDADEACGRFELLQDFALSKRHVDDVAALRTEQSERRLRQQQESEQRSLDSVAQAETDERAWIVGRESTERGKMDTRAAIELTTLRVLSATTMREQMARSRVERDELDERKPMRAAAVSNHASAQQQQQRREARESVLADEIASRSVVEQQQEPAQRALIVDAATSNAAAILCAAATVNHAANNRGNSSNIDSVHQQPAEQQQGQRHPAAVTQGGPTIATTDDVADDHQRQQQSQHAQSPDVQQQHPVDTSSLASDNINSKPAAAATSNVGDGKNNNNNLAAGDVMRQEQQQQQQQPGKDTNAVTASAATTTTNSPSPAATTGAVPAAVIDDNTNNNQIIDSKTQQQNPQQQQVADQSNLGNNNADKNSREADQPKQQQPAHSNTALARASPAGSTQAQVEQPRSGDAGAKQVDNISTDPAKNDHAAAATSQHAQSPIAPDTRHAVETDENCVRNDIAATEQSSRNELLAIAAAAEHEQQQQEQERLREQQKKQQEEAEELERKQREQEQQQQREQHFTTDRAQFESSESAARTAIEREQHTAFTSLRDSAALQHDELQQRAAISADESQQHRSQLLRDEAAARTVSEQLEQQRHRREQEQQNQLSREQQQHDEAAPRHDVEFSEQDERGLLQSSTALSVSETRLRFAAAAEEASGRRSIVAVATRSQCEAAEGDSRHAATEQEAATRMQLADSCAASEHQASQAQLERERREAEEERQRLEQQQQRQQREQLHREQRSNLELQDEAAARSDIACDEAIEAVLFPLFATEFIARFSIINDSHLWLTEIIPVALALLERTESHFRRRIEIAELDAVLSALEQFEEEQHAIAATTFAIRSDDDDDGDSDDAGGDANSRNNNENQHHQQPPPVTVVAPASKVVETTRWLDDEQELPLLEHDEARARSDLSSLEHRSRRALAAEAESDFSRLSRQGARNHLEQSERSDRMFLRVCEIVCQQQQQAFLYDVAHAEAVERELLRRDLENTIVAALFVQNSLLGGIELQQQQHPRAPIVISAPEFSSGTDQSSSTALQSRSNTPERGGRNPAAAAATMAVNANNNNNNNVALSPSTGTVGRDGFNKSTSGSLENSGAVSPPPPSQPQQQQQQPHQQTQHRRSPHVLDQEAREQEQRLSVALRAALEDQEHHHRSEIAADEQRNHRAILTQLQFELDVVATDSSLRRCKALQQQEQAARFLLRGCEVVAQQQQLGFFALGCLEAKSRMTLTREIEDTIVAALFVQDSMLGGIALQRSSTVSFVPSHQHDDGEHGGGDEDQEQQQQYRQPSPELLALLLATERIIDEEAMHRDDTEIDQDCERADIQREALLQLSYLLHRQDQLNAAESVRRFRLQQQQDDEEDEEVDAGKQTLRNDDDDDDASTNNTNNTAEMARRRQQQQQHHLEDEVEHEARRWIQRREEDAFTLLSSDCAVAASGFNVASGVSVRESVARSRVERDEVAARLRLSRARPIHDNNRDDSVAAVAAAVAGIIVPAADDNNSEEEDSRILRQLFILQNLEKLESDRRSAIRNSAHDERTDIVAAFRNQPQQEQEQQIPAATETSRAADKRDDNSILLLILSLDSDEHETRAAISRHEQRTRDTLCGYFSDVLASVAHSELLQRLLQCERSEIEMRRHIDRDEAASRVAEETVVAVMMSLPQQQPQRQQRQTTQASSALSSKSWRPVFQAQEEATLLFDHFELSHPQAHLADTGVQTVTDTEPDPSSNRQHSNDDLARQQQRDRQLVVSPIPGAIVTASSSSQRSSSSASARSAACVVWILATMLGARWANSRRVLLINEDDQSHVVFTACEILHQAQRQFAAFRATIEVLYHQAALSVAAFAAANAAAADENEAAWNPYATAAGASNNNNNNRKLEIATPSYFQQHAAAVFQRATELFLDLERKRRLDLSKRWYNGAHALRAKALRDLFEAQEEATSMTAQAGQVRLPPLPRMPSPEQAAVRTPSRQPHTATATEASRDGSVAIEIYDFHTAMQRRQQQQQQQVGAPAISEPARPPLALHHRFTRDMQRHQQGQSAAATATGTSPPPPPALLSESRLSSPPPMSTIERRAPTQHDNRSAPKPHDNRSSRRHSSSLIPNGEIDVRHLHRPSPNEQEEDDYAISSDDENLNGEMIFDFRRKLHRGGAAPSLSTTRRPQQQQQQRQRRKKFGLVLSDGMWLRRRNNNAGSSPQRHLNFRDDADDDDDTQHQQEKHSYGCLRVVTAKPPSFPSIMTGDLILSINGERAAAHADAERMLRRRGAEQVARPVVFEVLRLHPDREETIHTIVITPQL